MNKKISVISEIIIFFFLFNIEKKKVSLKKMAMKNRFILVIQNEDNPTSLQKSLQHFNSKAETEFIFSSLRLMEIKGNFVFITK